MKFQILNRKLKDSSDEVYFMRYGTGPKRLVGFVQIHGWTYGYIFEPGTASMLGLLTYARNLPKIVAALRIDEETSDGTPAVALALNIVVMLWQHESLGECALAKQLSAREQAEISAACGKQFREFNRHGYGSAVIMWELESMDRYTLVATDSGNDKVMLFITPLTQTCAVVKHGDHTIYGFKRALRQDMETYVYVSLIYALQLQSGQKGKSLSELVLSETEAALIREKADAVFSDGEVENMSLF